MQRESQKDRTILCKFHPTEPGDYRVEVKWAGELVPGSPFNVMIFDTQEELNRFLQVNFFYYYYLNFTNLIYFMIFITNILLQGQQSPGSELYGSITYGHLPSTTGRQPSWRGSQPTL